MSYEGGETVTRSQKPTSRRKFLLSPGLSVRLKTEEDVAKNPELGDRIATAMSLGLPEQEEPFIVNNVRDYPNSQKISLKDERGNPIRGMDSLNSYFPSDLFVRV